MRFCIVSQLWKSRPLQCRPALRVQVPPKRLPLRGAAAPSKIGLKSLRAHEPTLIRGRDLGVCAAARCRSFRAGVAVCG